MANKARGTFLQCSRPLYNESAETTNQDSTANQKDDTDTATFNDSDSPDGARAVDGAGEGGGEGEEPAAAKGAKPEKAEHPCQMCVEKKESMRSVGEEFWNHKSDAARINLQKGLVDLRQLAQK